MISNADATASTFYALGGHVCTNAPGLRYDEVKNHPVCSYLMMQRQITEKRDIRLRKFVHFAQYLAMST